MGKPCEGWDACLGVAVWRRQDSGAVSILCVFYSVLLLGHIALIPVLPTACELRTFSFFW